MITRSNIKIIILLAVFGLSLECLQSQEFLTKLRLVATKYGLSAEVCLKIFD